MNASKRIEEFILKLSIRQNDHGLSNKVNEIKRKIENIQIRKDDSNNKNCNKT